jgi:hypothetical protein
MHHEPKGHHMKTIGISPKVYVPAVGQVIVGVVLIVLGLDVEGKTAISTGIGTFLLGYGAKPAPLKNAP